MPLAVLSAMAEEIELYLERCTVTGTVERAGLTFHEAKFAGHQLVVVKAGVGKVNAAMAAQLLIDAFAASPIICTGTAGALHDGLDIGDIVIAEDCVHHDIKVDFLDLPRGQIPFSDLRFFPTSERLRDGARSVELADHRVSVGRVLTGDAFVQDPAYRQLIQQELGGDCVEMEGAAVGQVCALNEVPYLVVRAISDRADGTSDVDFQTFVREAARSSAQIVLHLLEALSPETLRGEEEAN